MRSSAFLRAERLTRSAATGEVNRAAAVVGAGMNSSGERRVIGTRTDQAPVLLLFPVLEHTSSRATVVRHRGIARMEGSMERGLVPAARKEGKEGKGQGGRVLPLLGRRVRMLVFLEPHVYMMRVSLCTASSCAPRTAVQDTVCIHDERIAVS
jgi:hypothetical protein